jgi:hypothetical protein
VLLQTMRSDREPMSELSNVLTIVLAPKQSEILNKDQIDR